MGRLCRYLSILLGCLAHENGGLRQLFFSFFHFVGFLICVLRHRHQGLSRIFVEKGVYKTGLPDFGIVSWVNFHRACTSDVSSGFKLHCRGFEFRYRLPLISDLSLSNPHRKSHRNMLKVSSSETLYVNT